MARFCVLLLLVLASPALAGNPGVDFTAMPVGLQAWYQGSENRRWVDVYIGMQGGHHVMERRRNSAYGALMETRHYNAQGHEVLRISEKGWERRFAPRNCMRVMGPCKAQVSDSRTGDHIVHGTMHRAGDTYYFKWQATGQGNTMRAHYKLGAYNLPTWNRSNDYLVVLTDIVEPSGHPAGFAR